MIVYGHFSRRTRPVERLSPAPGHRVLSRFSVPTTTVTTTTVGVIVVPRREYNCVLFTSSHCVISLSAGHRTDALRHGFRLPKRPRSTVAVIILVHPPTHSPIASGPWGKGVMITSVAAAANVINATNDAQNNSDHTLYYDYVFRITGGS